MCNKDDFVFKGPEFKHSPLEKSFGHFILKCLSHNKNNIFQIDPETDSKMTRDELRVLSIRCAIQLKQYGLKKGDTVLFCLDNRKYTAIPFIACIFLGVAVTYMSDIVHVSDHQRMTDLLKPKLILSNENMVKKYEEIIKDLNMDVPIFEYNNEKFEQTFLKVSPDENNFEPEEVDIQSTILIIICSSGTTGSMKGAIQTHDTFYKAIIKNKFKFTPNDRVFCYTEMLWNIGVLLVVYSIAFDLVRIAPIIPSDAEYLDKTAKLFEKYNVNYFIAVPVELITLVHDSNFERYPAIKNPSVIWCTGQVVQKSHFEKFRSAFPNSHVINVYGATEYMNSIAYMFEKHREWNLKKVMSSGPLIHETFAKIVDPKTGKSLSKNHTGRLYVKVNSLTPGYYKNPEETRLAIKDGWYDTGDIAYFDDDECLFVIARSNEIFKYDSYAVVPTLIEQIIDKYPGVKKSCVMGVPNDRHGEMAMAFVVKTPGFNVTSEEIIKHVEENCQSYQWLYGGVRFLDKFPLTHSGKIKRYVLQKLLS